MPQLLKKISSRKAGSLIFVLMLFQAGLTLAQNGYAVSSIPDTLKKNATTVLREQNMELDVSDVDRAVLNVHRVVTILNERGKQALFFVKRTDKFVSLADVEIKTYDSTGKNLGKFKQRDLTMLAIGEDLMDDSKMNMFEVPVSSYPMTVEYRYEMKYKGILSYPPYQIGLSGEAVEFSSYIAKVKKELDLRYKEKNILLPPVVAEEGKYKSYTWSVKDRPAAEEEEGAAGDESGFPSILLAPNHFKLDDYEGDMTSWASFGRWYGDLKKGIDVLPGDRKGFYRDLVKNSKNDREKIKILYEYLQRNFRYVSIQLGIGGFRPFPAEFTDKKKYGDCKALSNYMQAILEAVGIKSYQALINAEYNSEPVDPSFPCNLFDHVILCVPGQKDSIWLECTSKTNDFAHLGTFTENRNALLITEKGGVLVRTPASRAGDNVFSAYTTIDLHANGSGKTVTILNTTGEYKGDLIHAAQEKADDQKSFFVDHLGFKDPDETLFQEDLSGSYKVEVGQHLERIPQLRTGSKMFLPLRIYRLWTNRLPSAEKRKQDFYFSCPFEKTDTTAYALPEGYRPEALPEAKNSKCAMAACSTSYWYDEKKRQLFSAIRVVLTQNKISAKDYAAVKDFFDALVTDDTQKIVIRKEG
jgi:Domain of Unknown Function with PDB structure (DUF3857)